MNLQLPPKAIVIGKISVWDQIWSTVLRLWMTNRSQYERVKENRTSETPFSIK